MSSLLRFQPCLEHQNAPQPGRAVVPAAQVLFPGLAYGRRLEIALAAQPGFVQQADAIKAKGVDTIACIAVNDAFVMGAWGKDQGTAGKVTMLADGAAAFAKAIGLELDLNARGMGWRSQRYALIDQDGKVTHLAVEQPGGFEVSSAEAIIAAL